MPSKQSKKMWGGSTLAVLFGALLFSWFFNIFFIYPYIGYGTYTLNFATFLNLLFTLQLPALTFLAVALLVWFGYIGAWMHKGRGMKAILFLPTLNPLLLLMALPAIAFTFLLIAGSYLLSRHLIGVYTHRTQFVH